jgi:hypothetical protein
VSGKGPQSLISFGEIAKLCANHFNRTIIENEAWKRREWVALGKLLEVLFADQLGEVKIQSDGMTEADAIELDGSLAAFISQRLKEWAGIGFVSDHRPVQWDDLFTSAEAQACANAYVRPCLIEKKIADQWLADHNIVGRKTRAVEPGNVGRGPGRPSKSNELLRAKEILSTSRLARIKKLIGHEKPTKLLIARKMVEAFKLTVAPKTITNRYGEQFKAIIDALNSKDN